MIEEICNIIMDCHRMLGIFCWIVCLLPVAIPFS